jgi:PTH1 family peptidyl-tRNA hydrolase
MFLIVGLGNPGNEYRDTRHNIGFMIADSVHDYYEFSPPKLKFKSEISEGLINGHKALLQKPLTYMNLSGSAVLQAASFLKIPMENIVVIHDDLDLAVGKIRVKTGGGAGGHNGLKDIDARLGREYTRVRIGIDHPGDSNAVADYVLNNFNKDDRQVIDKIIEGTTKHIGKLLSGNKDLFMTRAMSISVKAS